MKNESASHFFFGFGGYRYGEPAKKICENFAKTDFGLEKTNLGWRDDSWVGKLNLRFSTGSVNSCKLKAIDSFLFRVRACLSRSTKHEARSTTGERVWLSPQKIKSPNSGVFVRKQKSAGLVFFCRNTSLSGHVRGTPRATTHIQHHRARVAARRGAAVGSIFFFVWVRHQKKGVPSFESDLHRVHLLLAGVFETIFRRKQKKRQRLFFLPRATIA